MRSQDGSARDCFVIGLVTAVTTAVVFLPQIIVWQIMYGPGAESPYVTERKPAFYWLQPQVGNVLFSATRGLFAWHPIFLLSALGLPLVFRRDRDLALGLILLLVLNVYIVAAWWSWWQGASFGGRMFLNATWAWVLALAALIDWLSSRRASSTAVLVGTVLIAWNALALVQYRLGLIPWEEPLTWTQLTTERFELPRTLLKRFSGSRDSHSEHQPGRISGSMLPTELCGSQPYREPGYLDM